MTAQDWLKAIWLNRSPEELAALADRLAEEAEAREAEAREVKRLALLARREASDLREADKYARKNAR